MNTVNGERYMLRRSSLHPSFKDASFKSARLTATALIISGLTHVCLFALRDYNWDGPISPRKPALFGLSAGLTIYSLVWCGRSLGRDRQLARIISAISWSLFLEVSLITFQFWRGVPSHFNRSTCLDGTVEVVMVGLITGVTVGITWVCWFSMKSFEIDASKLLAIRAGLSFLLLSCLLGYATMLVGEYNQSMGRPVETWGGAGVLKYPHGATLHALQTLPLLNWALTKLAVPRRAGLVMIGVSGHGVFLCQALWQTCRGRSRLDVDLVGGILLLLTLTLFFTVVIAMLLHSVFQATRALFANAASRRL